MPSLFLKSPLTNKFNPSKSKCSLRICIIISKIGLHFSRDPIWKEDLSQLEIAPEVANRNKEEAILVQLEMVQPHHFSIWSVAGAKNDHSDGHRWSKATWTIRRQPLYWMRPTAKEAAFWTGEEHRRRQKTRHGPQQSHPIKLDLFVFEFDFCLNGWIKWRWNKIWFSCPFCPFGFCCFIWCL